MSLKVSCTRFPPHQNADQYHTTCNIHEQVFGLINTMLFQCVERKTKSGQRTQRAKGLVRTDTMYRTQYCASMTAGNACVLKASTEKTASALIRRHAMNAMLTERRSSPERCGRKSTTSVTYVSAWPAM